MYVMRSLIRTVLKRDSLLLLLPNIIPEYATKNIQENWKGLKLQYTPQLLVYANDVNFEAEN